MRIESILRRVGGTKIDLGGHEYHFVTEPDGRQVADVEDDDHIGHLLSIREGFRRAIDRNTMVTRSAAIVAPNPSEVTTIMHSPAALEVLAAMATPETPAVSMPVAAATFIPTQPEDAQRQINSEMLDEDTDDATDVAALSGPPDSAARDLLIDEFVKKYGKKPHHKLSNERIAALNAAV